MQERKVERYNAALGVVITEGGVNEPCLTRSVSRGGLFALTKKRWPMGTVVQLQIVHGSHRIITTARVAFIDEHGVGFGFADADGAFQASMDALLAELVPQREARSEAAHVWWGTTDATGLLGKWKNRRRKARVIDISVDGAAIESSTVPELGSQILVSLDAESDEDTCATVMRATEHGFAVRFDKPSLEFRKGVSELRRRHKMT